MAVYSRSSVQNTNNRRFRRFWKNECILNLINNQPNIDKIFLYVYKNIDEYNTDKVRKILIVFGDMIADMINNKKLNSIIKLFIRGRKLNISLVFITQSYFKVPKDVTLNSTRFFIMKIPNKRELQQIALNHSLDISSKYFIKTHKKYPYPFLVNDATLASDNPLKFRKIFLIYNKIMTIDDQIKNDKLQYDINKEPDNVNI